MRWRKDRNKVFWKRHEEKLAERIHEDIVYREKEESSLGFIEIKKEFHLH